MALHAVAMCCCDDPLILKGVDRHEKVGKASLNPLCGGKICMDGVDMTMLDVEDVYHSAGYSCCSVLEVRFNSDLFKECSDEAICGMMDVSCVESVQER